MESALLSEFIKHTGADTALARDILEGQQWDMKSALQVFYFLSEHNLYKKVTPGQNEEAKKMENKAIAVPTESQTQPAKVNVVFDVPGSKKKEEQEAEDTVNESGLSFQKVMLSKSNALDIGNHDYKKLSRGISRATDNVNLVSKARSKFAQDFSDTEVCHISQYFIDTPIYTFTLPDLSVYPEDFRAFLEKDLIEISTLVSLEQAGRLNWWVETGTCQRLWPLATTGDGNCLLHAASLGMWGFHDRLLTLRKALHAFMTQSKHTAALYRRWRWQQTLQNAQAGFQYSEEEWQQEWDIILKMASTEPRVRAGRRRSSVYDNMLGGSSTENPVGETYESLEEIHVLALCHVLRRPIIIIADTVLKDVNGEALAPIPFGGMYLPLEIPPVECHRSPLVLTFDAAHFSALVVMEKNNVDKVTLPPAVIPLTDSEHQLLPIQFSVDPGENHLWGKNDLNPHVVGKDKALSLLQSYLDIVHVQIPPSYPASEDNWDNETSESPTDVSPTHASLEGDLDKDDGFFNFTESSLFGAGGAKGKSGKQLQSVARQFGSIGKSMGKKLKKNIGSIIGRSNSFRKKEAGAARAGGNGSNPARQIQRVPLISRSQDYILSALIHIDKRHEFQDEMIKNYLQSAQARFEKEMRVSGAAQNPRPNGTSDIPTVRIDGPVLCINPGCSMYGTAVTSYMCSSCYAKQKEQEQELNRISSPLLNKRSTGESALYGTGRSKFYTESDTGAHANLSKVPVTKAGGNNDQTLYLSKSTFYNDASAGSTNIPSYNLAKEESHKTRKTSNTSVRSEMAATEQPSRNTTFSTLVPRYNSELPGVSVNEMVKVTTPPPDSKKGTAPPSVTTTAPASSNAVSGLNMPCRNRNCQFYGSPETAYFCSKCFKETREGGGGSSMNVMVQQAKTSQV